MLPIPGAPTQDTEDSLCNFVDNGQESGMPGLLKPQSVLLSDSYSNVSAEVDENSEVTKCCNNIKTIFLAQCNA